MDPIGPVTPVTHIPSRGPGVPRLKQPAPRDIEEVQLRKLRKATGDFEALFLSQLLKPFEKAVSSSFGRGDNLGGKIMMQVAMEKMAESLSEHGGMGLGDVLYESLKKRVVADGSAHGSTTRGPVAAQEPGNRPPSTTVKSVKRLPGGLTVRVSDKQQ